ncbi:hypothetical protein FB567DRAFT_544657 [Paraphoma chrysanthemicola]|uniref:Uncharacterized protein n=1 Tax=Paraphoma chrysanthemicola TaxID=798071 RepID=A0A8K0REZ2_9PLEO|nr:hypothetical protein FB567DRAFT_544657 [Paraphoma chrysanthemicola]
MRQFCLISLTGSFKEGHADVFALGYVVTIASNDSRRQGVLGVRLKASTTECAIVDIDPQPGNNLGSFGACFVARLVSDFSHKFSNKGIWFNRDPKCETCRRNIANQCVAANVAQPTATMTTYTIFNISVNDDQKAHSVQSATVRVLIPKVVLRFITYSTNEAISAGLEQENPVHLRWERPALAKIVPAIERDDRVCAVLRPTKGYVEATSARRIHQRTDLTALRVGGCCSCVCGAANVKMTSVLLTRTEHTIASTGLISMIATCRGGGSASLITSFCRHTRGEDRSHREWRERDLTGSIGFTMRT